jgi:hypothetical protein
MGLPVLVAPGAAGVGLVAGSGEPGLVAAVPARIPPVAIATTAITAASSPAIRTRRRRSPRRITSVTGSG